jgi:small subunit ribosomal protein S8
MSSDPIGDMLAQIWNANHKFLEFVELPSSKVKVEIAKVLKDEGFITNYKVTSDSRQGMLRLFMRYTKEKARVLQGIKRVSRPGLRVYRGNRGLPKIQGGLGVVIVSTPKGIMTDEAARKKKVGGEVLAYAW